MFLRYSFVRNLSKAVDNYKVGDNVIIAKRITKQDLDSFASVTGDTNPVHFPQSGGKGVVHGALLNGLVSGIIGTKLPGPGTLVVSQNLNFPNKCYVDEMVTIKVDLVEARKIIKVAFSCEVVDQKKIVMYGDAKLIKNK